MPSSLTDADFDALIAGLVGEDTALLRYALDWIEPRVRDRHTASGEPRLDHALGTVRVLAADAYGCADARRCIADCGARHRVLWAAGSGQHHLRPGGGSPGPGHPRAFAARHDCRRRKPCRRGFGGAKGNAAQDAACHGGGSAYRADPARVQTADLALACSIQGPLQPGFARETLDLYAPLANPLGIWQVKWEMEDLAFRFTDPVRYKEIAALLEEKRVERETFIARTIETLTKSLQTSVAAEAGRQAKAYLQI